MSGYPIESPSERSAGVVIKVLIDVTNVRQKIELPTGAKWVSITYKLLPGATPTTGQYIKMAFNAASDDHANGLMVIPNASLPVFQGDDIQIPFEKPALCTRIDLQAVAAVGSEKTVVRIIAGV